MTANLPIVYFAGQLARERGASLIAKEQDEWLATTLAAPIMYDAQELLVKRWVTS
jgi:hypothetical protein